MEKVTRRVALSGMLGTGAAAWWGDEQPEGLDGRNQTTRTASMRARQRVDPRSISAVVTRRPVVTLTFDDGPDPATTPRVLDVLGDHGVRATFFMVGRLATQHPDLVREVLARGHQVANHTQDHLWLDRQPQWVVAAQVLDGARSLTAVGAPASALFRPPHGWTSPAVASVALRHRLRSIFWSDCLEKHLQLGPAAAATTMAAGVRRGSILLAHDGGHLDGPNPQSIDRSASVEALPHLLEAVLAKALRFVTLSDLIGESSP
ncbi:polysaccharide deacetylase family protein [Pedococcus sp. KACC 23699]|uniref:Polysaccharide deacetylase family protein n=1 Tax=Pedococcus sp. KACC 23699 TaxID=3149228 RepID=A0AAU7JX29_9MICO